MQRTENLVSAFREIVGDAHVVADQDKLKSLAVDDVIPGLMVSPGTIAETSKVMAVAHGLGLAVLPRGGGTKMSLGGIPARADLILSTKRMNGYADHDCDGQGAAEVRMILEGLDKGMIFREQIRKNGLQLNVAQADGKHCRHRGQHEQRRPYVVHDKFGNSLAQCFQGFPRPILI